MSDDQKMLTVIGALVLVIGYLLIGVIVSFVNVQNKMAWCHYKDGAGPWTTEETVHTGKRWEGNPFTIGLTGTCIDPGDKGL